MLKEHLRQKRSCTHSRLVHWIWVMRRNIFWKAGILFNWHVLTVTYLEVLWEVGTRLCGNKLPIECHREPADLELRGRLIDNWKHASEFRGVYHSTFVRFPSRKDIYTTKIHKSQTSKSGHQPASHNVCISIESSFQHLKIRPARVCSVCKSSSNCIEIFW